MGYKVTLYVEKSDMQLPSGHVYIGLTDDNGNEVKRGFSATTFSGMFGMGFFKGHIGYEIETVPDEQRDFQITKEQYNLILTEIEKLDYLASEGKLNYDLLDHDRDLDDFNCVTFAEHLLNAGGIDVKLGIIPHVAIDASYMNEYGKAYFNALSWIAGSDGKAELEFRNGNIHIENGGWDSHTTIPSSNITIDTAFNKTTNNFSISTSKEIDKKDFISGAIELASKVGTKQIQINNVTFNITQTDNLTARNAIDDIPAVSILLTHILIKPGEKLDLGDKGIYTVKSGDTLSEIAEANNTKELLKKNSWFVCHRDYANNIGYRRREVA